MKKQKEKLQVNEITIVSAFEQEFDKEFRKFFGNYILKRTNKTFHRGTEKEFIELHTKMNVLLRLLLKRTVTGDLIQLIYLHGRTIKDINKLDQIFSEMVNSNEHFRNEVSIVIRERLQFVFDLLEFILNSVIQKDGFIN